MAVQFELYKTPMPEEKKNKVRYHARPVSFETVNTEKLAYRIHSRSSLRVSDIKAVLTELKMKWLNALWKAKRYMWRDWDFFKSPSRV